MSPFSFFSHLLGCHTPSRDRPQTVQQQKVASGRCWHGAVAGWGHRMTLSPVGLTEPQNPSRTPCSHVYSKRDKQSPHLFIHWHNKGFGVTHTPACGLMKSSHFWLRTAFTLNYCCWQRGTLWKYHLDNAGLLSECIDLSTSVPGTIKPEMRANLTNHTGKMWSLGFKLLKLSDVLFKN